MSENEVVTLSDAEIVAKGLVEGGLCPKCLRPLADEADLANDRSGVCYDASIRASALLCGIDVDEPRYADDLSCYESRLVEALRETCDTIDVLLDDLRRVSEVHKTNVEVLRIESVTRARLAGMNEGNHNGKRLAAESKALSDAAKMLQGPDTREASDVIDHGRKSLINWREILSEVKS
jgi:hypothetical protein